MKLVHYSAKPLGEVLEVEQSEFADLTVEDIDEGCRAALEALIAAKPVGLWVSVVDEHGDGWADWCRREEYGISRLAVATEVVLAEDHRVLFTDPWQVDKRYGYCMPCGSLRLNLVDWRRVAKYYDGVVIAPWQPSASTYIGGPGLSWYRGWDCASGCIWNPRSVAELRPVEEAA
jgi:hypothetical protein